MVEDSYSDVLDVSEMKIDKLLKVSKYTNAGDGIYADDDVYQVVLDMFGNVGNVDKIQTAFAAVDYTKKAFSIVKLTGDVVKDFVTWGNSIAVLNAFAKTDENFKQVFRDVANRIPDSEKKMKEAIEDYLNYSVDFAGQFSEIYDSFCDLGKDVALDTFNGIVGKKLLDWLVVKSVGWIGNISFGGVKISTTAVYSTITSEAAKVIGGSALTGVSLGLCLSDLICDSSDKAAEMGKIIAMAEYAPYIIQTLENYEDNLYSAADNNAVDLFEKAFGLHQVSQSYIMDHTVNALQVKADSILQTILGNDDYDELVADILVQKNAIDSMECCGALTNDTIVQTIKVIAIKCPVDVYVYNENGTEIVKIISDTLESATDGITVYIRDRQKYIALPANQVYTIKIIATDDGMMEYVVCEYNEQMQLHRTIVWNELEPTLDKCALIMNRFNRGGCQYSHNLYHEPKNIKDQYEQIALSLLSAFPDVSLTHFDFYIKIQGILHSCANSEIALSLANKLKFLLEQANQTATWRYGFVNFRIGAVYSSLYGDRGKGLAYFHTAEELMRATAYTYEDKMWLIFLYRDMAVAEFRNRHLFKPNEPICTRTFEMWLNKGCELALSLQHEGFSDITLETFLGTLYVWHSKLEVCCGNLERAVELIDTAESEFVRLGYANTLDKVAIEDWT